MKIIVNPAPEAEITQTFPRLFSNVNSAEIAVFGTGNAGTWLTGEFAGMSVITEFNVYNSADWNLFPIGSSVTLVQE